MFGAGERCLNERTVSTAMIAAAATAVPRRHEESGVGHVQWIQDPLGEYVLKGLAFDAFKQDPQHIGGVAVRQPLTGLMLKG